MSHILNFILSVFFSAYAILYYDFYTTNPVDLISFFVYTNEIPPITYSFFIIIKFLIIFAFLFSYIDYFYPLFLYKTFKSKFKIGLSKYRAYTALGGCSIFFIFLIHQVVVLKSIFEKTDIYDHLKTEVPSENAPLKKNLILIIVESLENTYSNDRLFKQNLIPQLSAFPSLGDYRQVVGTGNTAAAMTGILCGTPTTARLQSFLLTKVTPAFEKLTCISDILKNNGYQNYFYTSDTMKFASKETFLKKHSFDELKGAEDLLRSDEDKGFPMFNGAADSRLFEFAYEKIASEPKKKPFFMILLTLNMHEPKGFLEKSCRFGKNDFTDIIRCTDKQLTEFVDKIKSLPVYKDTVIVIVGDHTARPNPVFSTLKKEPNRTLFNAVINASTPGEKRIFSPLDMGPTLLSLIGFGDNIKIGLGSSLFTPEHNLLEIKGLDDLNKELMKYSEKYNALLYEK